jgi:hypothetical protein
MNATHSLNTTATDPLTPNDDIAFTPKAIKIFLAIVIPITIIILITFGIAWKRWRTVHLMDIEMEHFAQELGQITQDPSYHPHPIPPPPVYIPAIPLHRTQHSHGRPRGSPSTDATIGHSFF